MQPAKRTIYLISTLATTFLLSSNIYAGPQKGDKALNGGDPCEMRIQDIISDLKTWINDRDPESGKVGPDGLTELELFRDGVNLNGDSRGERIADYIERMNAQIKDRKFYTQKQLDGVTTNQNKKLLVVQCVKSEKPIDVNVDLSDLAQPEFKSFERVCWNSGGDSQVAQITCDRDVFERLNWDSKKNEDMQYSLIHHEIAGLAGIEGNFRYGLSRILSEFMETKEVQMLGRKRHDHCQNGGCGGDSNLTDILKDGSGSLITGKNQYQAADECAKRGMRLPTIRELAQWATQYGAAISDCPKDGYSEIDASDASGNPDKLYFSWSGYHAPTDGGLGQYLYWSSSVVPGVYDGAFTLDGTYAWIQGDARSDNRGANALRCAR